MKWMNRVLGITPWKREWQEGLSRTLAETQKGLSVSMVVVIARESDLYAELLYLLSFLGLSVGSIAAYLLRGRFSEAEPFFMLPLLGFALGSTLFSFRRRFIHRFAPRAVRERVAGRAKGLFYDHDQHLKGRLALLYLSELEQEALFLASPELSEKTPGKEVQKILSRLVIDYDHRNPMKTLGPALSQLGELLHKHYGPAADNEVHSGGVLFPENPGAPSDRRPHLHIPILKGSKDIN